MISGLLAGSFFWRSYWHKQQLLNRSLVSMGRRRMEFHLNIWPLTFHFLGCVWHCEYYAPRLCVSSLQSSVYVWTPLRKLPDEDPLVPVGNLKSSWLTIIHRFCDLTVLALHLSLGRNHRQFSWRCLFCLISMFRFCQLIVNLLSVFVLASEAACEFHAPHPLNWVLSRDFEFLVHSSHVLGWSWVVMSS